MFTFSDQQLKQYHANSFNEVKEHIFFDIENNVVKKNNMTESDEKQFWQTMENAWEKATEEYYITSEESLRRYFSLTLTQELWQDNKLYVEYINAMLEYETIDPNDALESIEKNVVNPVLEKMREKENGR